MTTTTMPLAQQCATTTAGVTTTTMPGGRGPAAHDCGSVQFGEQVLKSWPLLCLLLVLKKCCYDNWRPCPRASMRVVELPGPSGGEK